MDGILALVKMIAGLAAVLLLIVLTLKYLNRFTSQANENFRVMKKIAVTKSSSLAIVLIIDKYYVMSFSEQENKIIKELSKEEAEKLTAEIEELHPDMDVDAHMGGQPIYYYVLAVE